MPSTIPGKKSFCSLSSSSSSCTSFSSSSSSSCVSLQINEDDWFFSKLLSREDSSSLADRTVGDDGDNTLSSFSSRALYYGGRQGSIPFTWESRPGTPKSPTVFPGSDVTYQAAAAGDTVTEIIPPLTPPPNAYFSSLPPTPFSLGNKRLLRRNKQHNLSLSGLVSKAKSSSGIARTRSHTLSLSTCTSLSPWAWSSGSGEGWEPAASVETSSSCHSPGRDRQRQHNHYHSSRSRIQSDHGSPDSTLSFGTRRKLQLSSAKKFWACGPIAKVKRVILSLVSSHHRRATK